MPDCLRVTSSFLKMLIVGKLRICGSSAKSMILVNYQSAIIGVKMFSKILKYNEAFYVYSRS